MKALKFSGMCSKDILKTLNKETPPFNPFDIANEMGVKVDTSLNWENIRTIKDGKIYLENDEIVIWINPLMPQSRQNFTLAHELGHLVYDVLPNIEKFKDKDNLDYKTFYRNGDKNAIETRANKFAGALLMPVDIIHSTVKEIQAKDPDATTDQYIDGLASIFEASKEAIIVRLKTLKVLRQDYYYPYIK